MDTEFHGKNRSRDTEKDCCSSKSICHGISRINTEGHGRKNWRKNRIKHLPRINTEFHGRKNKIKHLPRKDTEFHGRKNKSKHLPRINTEGRTSMELRIREVDDCAGTPFGKLRGRNFYGQWACRTGRGWLEIGAGIKGIFTAKTLSSQRKNSNGQWVCFKAHALRCMGLLFTMRVI